MLRILLKFQDTVLKVVESENDQITIGRNLQNDIQIDNLAVSSFHARVEKEMGLYFIEDLKSTNGTFVNDQRVTRWGLQDGDAVSIGKHTLVFMIENAETDDRAGVRELEMDRTMVLDTKRHRELLEKDLPEGDKPKEPPGKLRVMEGSTDRPEYELTERLVAIGKDASANIRLQGLLAPKNAGFIARGLDGYILSAGDKPGKLRLNGRPIADNIRLKDGDLIEIGGIKMRFEQP